mgnify:CR=1 FL=1
MNHNGIQSELNKNDAINDASNLAPKAGESDAVNEASNITLKPGKNDGMSQASNIIPQPGNNNDTMSDVLNIIPKAEMKQPQSPTSTNSSADSFVNQRKPESQQENITDIIYTVSNIAALLRDLVNQNFSDITIRGEISNLKIASSGHVYFSLKDGGALLNAICWKSVATKSHLQEGMEVICQGDLAIYPERSVYQLIDRKSVV